MIRYVTFSLKIFVTCVVCIYNWLFFLALNQTLACQWAVRVGIVSVIVSVIIV